MPSTSTSPDCCREKVGSVSRLRAALRLDFFRSSRSAARPLAITCSSPSHAEMGGRRLCRLPRELPWPLTISAVITAQRCVRRRLWRGGVITDPRQRVGPHSAGAQTNQSRRDHVSICVDTDLEPVFGEIQTDGDNLHGDSSSRCGAQRRPRCGTSMPGAGAVHPIKTTGRG